MSRTDATDAALIERVATLDYRAFEELYARFARPVLALALRRLRDRGRAEQVVPEVFTAVWRSAARYDSRRGPGAAWLYSIACDVVPAGRLSPEEAEAAWNAFCVHRFLETLPEAERRAIDLAYFSGLSPSEAAGFLDMPLEAVKIHVRDGLGHLADALAGER